MSASRKTGAPAPEASADAWRSMSAGAQVLQPLLTSASRVNAEIAGFATARARAWMEAQSALLRCRTPQDVIDTQMSFWRDASREWLDASQRIGAAWQTALVTSRSGGQETASRDYIDLAGGVDTAAPPPAANGHALRRQPDRRAAA